VTTQQDSPVNPVRVFPIRVRRQDFHRALDFYAGSLNCCIYSESSSLLQASDGFRIALIEDDVGGDPARLRSIRGRGPVAELVVEDFDERVRELSLAGCRFARSPTDSGAQLSFIQLADPFEYLWMLRRFDESLHADMKG
jgi:hypothetical protein